MDAEEPAELIDAHALLGELRELAGRLNALADLVERRLGFDDHER